jgi:hypothetical protein
VLAEAIAAAAPEGYVRVFVDAAHVCCHSWTARQSNSAITILCPPSRPSVLRISMLHSGDAEPAAHRPIAAEGSPNLVDPLSDREMECCCWSQEASPTRRLLTRW